MVTRGWRRGWMGDYFMGTVSVLQDEKQCGDELHTNVNALCHTTPLK